MSAQLTFALGAKSALSRADFIVAPGNVEAVTFIDSWPNWSTNAVALFGPPGCGKSHLANAWAERVEAKILDARALDDDVATELRADAVVVDNVDAATPAGRDHALFVLLNRPCSILLIGREAPAVWPVLMPDLASRFRALLAFPLWAPDDALLAALARKLFADRQLRVPENVIARMVVLVERSPASIREFVERLDREALAQGREINLTLVRELLASAP